MLKNQLDLLNAEINRREHNRPLRKMLPFLLILSFAFVVLFENYSQSSFEVFEYKLFGFDDTFGEWFFANLFFGALIEWLWFEILFYVYKLFLGFSVFSYTISMQLLNNKARSFMVIRNVIWGIVCNLMFMIPQFLASFVVVLELVVDVCVFVWFTFSVMRETVDTIIKPNVMKTLTLSFLIMRACSLIMLIVGVL